MGPRSLRRTLSAVILAGSLALLLSRQERTEELKLLAAEASAAREPAVVARNRLQAPGIGPELLRGVSKVRCSSSRPEGA
jgi:hypothetical protein